MTRDAAQLSHELVTPFNSTKYSRMDENAQSFSPSNLQLESPKISIPKPAGSGLTLVIPSLKSLKASQSTVKKPRHSVGSVSHSSSIYPDVDTQEKKIPRPIKLKPLKEVLTKLITQIKKLLTFSDFLELAFRLYLFEQEGRLCILSRAGRSC